MKISVWSGICVIILGVWMAAAPQTAWAQGAPAVRGTVTDPSGAVVPKATVHLIDANEVERVATTDDKGRYAFDECRARFVSGSRDRHRLRDFRTGRSASFVRRRCYGERATSNFFAAPGRHCSHHRKRRASERADAIAAECRTRHPCDPARCSGALLRALGPGRCGRNLFACGRESRADADASLPPIPKSFSAKISILIRRGACTWRIAARMKSRCTLRTGSWQGKFRSRRPFQWRRLPAEKSQSRASHRRAFVDVFDASGRRVRSIGGSSNSADITTPNAQLSRGFFTEDGTGHFYYSLMYLPDPTIRKYDEYGYAAYEIAIP